MRRALLLLCCLAQQGMAQHFSSVVEQRFSLRQPLLEIKAELMKEAREQAYNQALSIFGEQVEVLRIASISREPTSPPIYSALSLSSSVIEQTFSIQPCVDKSCVVAKASLVLDVQRNSMLNALKEFAEKEHQLLHAEGVSASYEYSPDDIHREMLRKATSVLKPEGVRIDTSEDYNVKHKSHRANGSFASAARGSWMAAQFEGLLIAHQKMMAKPMIERVHAGVAQGQQLTVTAAFPAEQARADLARIMGFGYRSEHLEGGRLRLSPMSPDQESLKAARYFYAEPGMLKSYRIATSATNDFSPWGAYLFSFNEGNSRELATSISFIPKGDVFGTINRVIQTPNYENYAAFRRALRSINITQPLKSVKEYLGDYQEDGYVDCAANLPVDCALYAFSRMRVLKLKAQLLAGDKRQSFSLAHRSYGGATMPFSIAQWPLWRLAKARLDASGVEYGNSLIEEDYQMISSGVNIGSWVFFDEAKLSLNVPSALSHATFKTYLDSGEPW